MAGSIEVQGLVKSFGSFRAVDDVSFKATEGAITALLGPSGSGKSTVLRMIAGLEQPDAGRIFVAAEELTNASVQERRLGFVFQHYALFRHMTVRDNVAFGLSVRHVAKSTQRRRVDELLDLVGLGPFAGRYPDQLSGGQRQRVALARALAPQPQVLLLDEPFGALDARVRQELRRWLDELHRELGVTSLFVTHDQEEALELANEVVVMNHGRIEQIGTANEIYNQPAAAFVAAFVGVSTVLRGVVRGGQVRSGQTVIAPAGDLAEGDEAAVFIRPQDVELIAAPTELSIPVNIQRVTALGWTSNVHMLLDDGQPLVAQLNGDHPQAWHAGTRLFVHLRNAKVFPEAGEQTVGPTPPDTKPEAETKGARSSSHAFDGAAEELEGLAGG